VQSNRDNDASIEQPATPPPGAEALPPGVIVPRRRASDRPSIDALPDWCNLGITLRVVTSVNLLFFGVVGVSARSWGVFVSGCLDVAASLEPILFASLLLGCLARRLLLPLAAPWQVAGNLAISVAATLIVEALLGPLSGLGSGYAWRDAALAATVCGAILYWAYLRSQSNLPALAEARLQALQARIRPHFLFNSLNAVLGLIRTDPKRAESMLEDLAELFRVLMRDPRERVTLAEEIELCRQYLAIEALRLGERLQVHTDIEIGASGTLVPLLLLQPLVENAVHHGIEPSTAVGRIDLEVARNGSFVDILIANPWLGERAKRPGNQMALENVRQRLNLLYDLEGQLTTAVKNGRFEVRVRLPYTSSPHEHER
jgi:two-component system sensor histidine kinase AlgZ